jgi:hypothetical protein
MSSAANFIEQFRADISRLISEIETCMGPAKDPENREFTFQREAFRERRHQAQRLSKRLAACRESQQTLLEGDAYRIHESLKLSLDYFRDS